MIEVVEFGNLIHSHEIIYEIFIDYDLLMIFIKDLIFLDFSLFFLNFYYKCLTELLTTMIIFMNKIVFLL